MEKVRIDKIDSISWGIYQGNNLLVISPQKKILTEMLKDEFKQIRKGGIWIWKDSL